MRLGKGSRQDRYHIYVGLNDKDELSQRFATETFQKVAKKVCCNYVGAYSMDVIQGGYVHENGTHTEENSLMVTLIGADEEKVAEIAEDLCAFFRQESVMVTKESVEAFFVKSSLCEEP